MTRHRDRTALATVVLTAAAWPGLATAQVVLNKTFGTTDYATVRDVGETGDVDGDGVPDYVIGLPAEEVDGVVKGVARVISGADAGTLLLVAGHAEFDSFGWSVDGVGDIDQDGYGDFAVGAIEATFANDEPGYACVVAGSDGHTIYEWVGNHPGQQFGQCVSGIGDYDLDGFDDILVCEADAIPSGTAWVRSGRTGLVLATYTAGGISLGFSCDCAGDVNADGILDIILGSYFDAFAEVVSGGLGAVLYTFTGTTNYFGLSVAGVGDVNDDGHADFGVGDPYTAAAGTDYVNIYSGLDGSVITRLVGNPSQVDFGHAMAPAGDVNGDGFTDVAIGAFGSVQAVSVFDIGEGRMLWSANGAPTSSLGYSMCNVGDVNGDGLLEIAATALTEDLLGVPGVGAVYLLTTSTSPWTELGHGSTATGRPVLEGIGPTANGAITLSVTDAPAFALAALVAGSAFAGWPLPDVTLVPSPDVVVAGLQTDALGSWQLVSQLPAGIPSGSVFYLQVFVTAPGTALVATNALAFTAG